MHLVENTKPIDMGNPGMLAPGKWLFDDQNAFELATLADKGSIKLTARTPYAWSPNDIIMRSGAFGDLLLLTPALRELAKAGSSVRLSSYAQHWPMFEGTGLVQEFHPYPLPVESDDEGWRFIKDLQGAEHSRTRHLTDSFADMLGVTVTDYKPIYFVTPDESEWAKKFVWPRPRPLLGVQMRSSTENRNYPPTQWLEVVMKLEQRGWEIIILGSKGSVPPLPPECRTPFIHNLCEIDLPFRQSAAVLSHCDAFVGVDSVWLHMCHALDIPAIGLFGPFDWKLRTSKAPLTQVISGHGDCAPCFWHHHFGRHFPENQPCSKIGRCVVLQGIHPDRIVRKVDSLKP